jgi:hypothetical protein
MTYPLRATSGADGAFHFEFAETELDARWLDEARPEVVAVADGYGLDWAEVSRPLRAGKGAELSLQLVEDLPVEGRILNRRHQPVAGVRVLVRDLGNSEEREVGKGFPGSCRGPLPGQPPSVLTDADGRFRLTGLGRDRNVALEVDGTGLQQTSLTVATRPAETPPSSRPGQLGPYLIREPQTTVPSPYPWQVLGATFACELADARPLGGVVRDRASGKPIAGVKVSVGGTSAVTLTDEAGRYEMPGCPRLQEYDVRAQPDNGQPYFAATARVPDRLGDEPLTVDFDLVRGIFLHGRITDQATGKPPRAAVAEYYPLFPNPHSSALTNGAALAASSAVMRADGSYTLAVLPGPGVVCVAASPRNAYAVARVDERELAGLVKDGINHQKGHNPRTAVGARGQDIVCVNRYNGLSLIKPSEGAEGPALDFPLPPARTLQGNVVGPDGEPLTGVSVIGLTAFPDSDILGNSAFAVTGLNPQRPRDLFFRHKGKALGKVLTVQGDEPEPLTVRLEPCGSASGRLVDGRGKGVAGVTVCFLPGGHGQETATAATDDEGRFRVFLVPGQAYAFGLSSFRRLLKVVPPAETASGENKDLGDLPLGD